MTPDGQRVRLGVDIGGTFTDVAMEVGERLHSTKVLTTPDEPERAILDSIRKVCAEAEVAADEIDLILHGTTLATNALIQRRGAKTAFITTEGFRDVIEMRTESRFEQYDLNIVLPAPLISREHRYPVDGRIAASGRELAPLDEEALRDLVGRLAGDYESVAIGLLHSYVNDAHERRAREIFAEAAPGLSVSISSEVSPQMREFERFNTVCANAFVKPLMASYLNRLADKLRAAGTTCPVFMLHSGGGLISLETAAAFPVRLLESGPAGGAIYAADVAARYGLDRVLSYDMGGTTAKICLIENQTPRTARTFEVARTARFAKGSGMPISIPVIEMVEIGAGGGSLASVDSMRQIRVGPESAGSEPGPACYGRGGTQAAVTDADLLLGKLDADDFAGGAFSLSVDAAAQALDAVGKPLGMNAPEAAIGVAEVVDETMANAARAHAVENGKDLSQFTMIAFGGAAPLHAVRLCEKLGIAQALIPPGAGVGSAIGFLRAPFGYEAVRGAYLRLAQFEAGWVDGVLDSLMEEAEAVARQGGDGALTRERKAYMRYEGQGWEIPVDLPDGSFGADTLRGLFETEYERLFGATLEGVDIEVMNWSARATMAAEGTVGKPSPSGRGLGERSLHPDKSTSGETLTLSRREKESDRSLFDSSAQSFAAAAVVPRATMQRGGGVEGPAIITEPETTTILSSGFVAEMQSDGCLLIRRRSVQ